jgi:transposase
MVSAVELTRLDVPASDLRRFARQLKTGREACRVLAIAMVLEGATRLEAATANGMDVQTLRDWVIRYNAEGVSGLQDRPRRGRPPALSEAQMVELKATVIAGPEMERDGVARWRCVDLQGWLAVRHGVRVHERTVGKLLRRLGLTRVQPRPYHPQKDIEAQEAFKKTSSP